MKTWSRFSVVGLTIVLFLSMLLAACGAPSASAPASTSDPAGAAVTNEAAPTSASAATSVPVDGASVASSPATNTQPVVLKFFHWIGNDAGPVVEEINKRFETENPGITVEFESLQTDQYDTVLKTRLAAGDAPDVFGVFPGTKKDPFVSAGYLMDLSSEPWAARVSQGSLGVAINDNKVYALPMDQNVLGVIYNKKIFADLGLEVPKTWDQFLEVSQKIKDAGSTPIALGNKDLWVTQLIPFAMAPSKIYRDNPMFDQEMYDGKMSFAGSDAWKKMMADYIELDKRGFFNKGVLGTTYDQTVQLISSEKAVMTVNGNWMIAPIKQANPDINLGMFPLPYTEDGTEPWVSSAVGSMMAISSSTKHPEEAQKYVEFWARPDIMALYLKEKKAYATLTDVDVDLDPAAAEMVPALKVGSYNFLDQKWPIGVQDQMFKDIQGVFAGSITIDEMFQNMDKVFQENKDK